MKARHVQGQALNARACLVAWNVSLGQDFHTLTSAQVDLVLKEAARVRYQKPKNANGSRARYFYQLTQRRAAWKGGQ